MESIRLDFRFFRLAGIAALLAALAVLQAQLWFSVEAPPGGFMGLMEVYAAPEFRARSWTILIQVAFMFVALLGLGVKLFPRAPSLALFALPCLLFWQLLELIPRSVDLFAASYVWAPAWLEAADAGLRATLEERFRLFWSVADAMREVRRVCWGLAHLLMGIAVWRVAGWPRVIAALMLLNALRLLLAITGGVTGLGWLGGGTTGFIALMVPQFLLIGLWLWREPDCVGRSDA